MKNNLYKPEFMTPQKNSSAFPSIKPLHPKKSPVATTEREDTVKPPEEAYDMGEFVGSIESIQKRINEMDLIFLSLSGEEHSGTNL